MGCTVEKRILSLRELRKSQQLTFEKVSKMLNVSKPYYWQIENGNRGLSYVMAIKIAKIFKTKPDKIFYNHFLRQIDK